MCNIPLTKIIFKKCSKNNVPENLHDFLLLEVLGNIVMINFSGCSSVLELSALLILSDEHLPEPKRNRKSEHYKIVCHCCHGELKKDLL